MTWWRDSREEMLAVERDVRSRLTREADARVAQLSGLGYSHKLEMEMHEAATQRRLANEAQARLNRYGRI